MSTRQKKSFFAGLCLAAVLAFSPTAFAGIMLNGAGALDAPQLQAHDQARSTKGPLCYQITANKLLKTVEFGNGKKMNFTVGFGSGMYHYKGDSGNIVYVMTDRGPNIKGKDSKEIIGENLCKKGKIYPVPGFTPTIYKIELNFKNKSYRILKTIKLEDREGNPVTGLPNPLKVMKTENAYDKYGKPIAFNPEGLDTESIIRLSNGTFWIGEEFAPSLVHVSSDGKILDRLVPYGVKNDISAADYPITEALPHILERRKLNRGIESLGISPDEKYLYFAIQSPLVNPDMNSYKKSRNVRLFKMNLASGKVVGEYVYVTDKAETFTLDHTTKQSKVKVSEMAALGTDKLLVLERVSKVTKLYKVSLSGATNILGPKWDHEATSPSLEELKADSLSSNGIRPLTKHIFLNSTDYPELPEKLEGIALLDNKDVILVNDNDFGIKGEKTIFSQVKIR